LNPTAIVEAAIRRVERHGEDKLTMRALASDMGVEAMSLYHHVPGRDALLDAMVQRFAELVPEPDAHLSWDELLRAYARTTRQGALAFPNNFRLLFGRRTRTPLALARADRILGALCTIGLTGETAVSAMRLWGSFVVGFVTDELATRPADENRWVASGDLPHLNVVVDLLDDAHSEVHFENGLNLIVLAVESIAPNPGAT
jgi:AcrR family transcriptional regulator